MFTLIRYSALALLGLFVLPSMAHAQAAITGVVKDTSDAVLPGVTVEAASPVLIEKVRTVVTDGSGQYRIVDLRPGTYSITFSLTGFGSVKREGIELTGTFVATVNADLKVGALEEAVTVSGQTPVVDVQSVKGQQVVTKEVFSAIPSARTSAGIQALIPGIVGSVASTPDVGGATGTAQGGTGSIHGGRPMDSRSLNDGLTTNHAGGGGGGGNNANSAGAQEIVINTSGGLGEAETGGVTVNIIPRDGGNTFSGTFFVSGASSSMQGSNFTQALKDQGLTGSSRILKVYDFNPMLGGPIIKDRLWFFLTERMWGAESTIPGLYVNKNAGNVNAWTYDPDTSKAAFNDTASQTHILRLTWQATARNKLTAYWSEQPTFQNERGGGSLTTSPSAGGGNTGSNQTIEATVNNNITPSRIQQVTWSSPLTTRILLEAGYGAFLARFGNGWGSGGRTDGTFDPRMIRVVEQSGPIPGLAFRAPILYQRSRILTRTWRASLSYVPGAHSMKFGYFGGFTNPDSLQFYYNEVSAYRFNNGVPNQLTLSGIHPGGIYFQRNLVPTSLYAQDTWTAGKLTLQGGVRYDHMTTWYPDQEVGGTRIIPTKTVFPARSTPGVNWNDITPRMGLAYDVFGTGRTAVKFNVGKYMESYLASQSADNDQNPLRRIAISTTRAWTDVNRDYTPDCDLTNPNGNGECGPMANRNLGTNTVDRTWDLNYTTGWGHRPYNWEFGASVQQQLASRSSVSIGYYRRWFGNWYATDNRANTAADWTPYTITAPLDPRLPGGGGYSIPGLYDLVPGKVGQVDDISTASSNFAKQTENWHGVDVIFNVRLNMGLTVQGGTSTGRRLADNCALRAILPELGLNGTFAVQNDTNPPTTINTATPTNPYCRLVEPFRTYARGLATYTVPKVNVLVSGTWQSNPGPEIAANYVVSNAVVRQTLGRDLSGSAANITANLIAPGTVYGARINQLDLRFAKVLRIGRTKAQLGLDVYNVLNTDTPMTYSTGFIPGGVWRVPTSLLAARFVKPSLQIDW